MSEFDGTLDLTGSDADSIGFPAIPSGRYEAVIAKETEWRKTVNIDGSKKLPHDTPFLTVAVQISTDEEPRDGQRVAGSYVWTQLYVPPADYDATKAQGMKNRFANFLKAVGEDFEKKGYKVPDVEDLIGREVTVVVRKKFDKQRDDYRNDIEGFKPAGSSQESDEPAGLLR